MKKNKVKELRLSQHLSQEQLAEKANVSVRTIQRLENEEDVSSSTLNLVAKALRVSVDDLLFELDPDEQQEKLQEQEDKRYTEFHTFKLFYSSIYIVIMLLIYTLISMLSISDNVYDILEILWIGGWMVMIPVRRWLIVNKVNPKLDQKYPLTAN
ncbi:helix-turn-helix domain-containing protein [Lactobacillus sp. PV034]|uniref:helix-turn-helix domain-containing protein n=1 Tax=Lactobacillus sp. PV034 TaxID=2594495 RepID=UPI00223FE6D6|nr:helix-turn-helix transcriptional regulator [Lactobacillus sp. PV034]QNQ80871.1 helix-turn-helix transcriptional regulator [Lactobacillus sp. PV034]